MKNFIRHRNNQGQTALEYTLVIAVICVGVIVIGKSIFGTPDSGAHKLMGKAIQEAEKTFDTKN